MIEWVERTEFTEIGNEKVYYYRVSENSLFPLVVKIFGSEPYHLLINGNYQGSFSTLETAKNMAIEILKEYVVICKKIALDFEWKDV